MSRTARTVADVLLGEAASGSRAQRLADMRHIASTIANRAAATGVSMEDIISAENQYSAYGKSLPPGVEAYRDLAEQVLAEIQRNGPTTTAQFYARPDAVANLPSGLSKVGQTRGHAYFTDPRGRALRTAQGYRKPNQADVVPEDREAALDAIFGFGPEAAPAVRTKLDDELDAVFGFPPQSSPAQSAAPKTKEQELDAVFGLERAPSPAPAIDNATAEWNGSFSSPLGAVTDRVTSGYGNRAAPKGSLGIGSANHMGVDLSAQTGQAGYPAESTAPGVVTRAGPLGRYGNVVDVEHPNGFTSRYGHLGSINVAPGDQIARGTPVGKVGSSGNSTGPHLHFEVRDQLGQPIDPQSLVDFSARRDTVTPTSRPMSPTEQRQMASAYGSLASSLAAAGVPGIGAMGAPTGLPGGFDMARFARDVDARSIGNLESLLGNVATAANRAPSTQAPSPERFGYSMDRVDPSRFGSAPSPASMASMGGLFSPAGGYAQAAAPDPSRYGPTQAMPSPDRFGYGALASSMGPLGLASGIDINAPQAPAKAGRLASQVTPASSTPISAMSPDLTAGLVSFADYQSLPNRSVSTVSTPVSAMGALPSTAAPPVGRFSAFNPVPTELNVVGKYAMPARTPAPAVTQQPNLAAAPKRAALPPAPAQRPPQRVADDPIGVAGGSVPEFTGYTANDVWTGRAPVGAIGISTGGQKVSRDRYGNTTIENAFGVKTTIDASGRMVSTPDSRVGNFMAQHAPDFIGGLLGNAIAGPLGGLLGRQIGSHIGPGGWHPSAPDAPSQGARGKGRGDLMDRTRADIDRGSGGLY